MRLHRLTVRAFGPFRDEQSIDLDALAQHGLFLLTGDTGAGKSSVLDAVVYALYGRLPGVRAGTARLRADHADPAVATQVTLELTVGGARLRVRRSPEWVRAKLRGSGTTKVPTKVTLERHTPEGWTVVSTRADETGDEVHRRLGMNHEQFCQVVLLPQGDFAQFLHADPDHRRRLLERLFATERFTAVERFLGERRREEARRLDQSNTAVMTDLARLAEVCGTEDKAPDVTEAEAVRLWAGRQLAEQREGHALAVRQVTRARRARSAAQADLDRARAAAERRAELRAVRERERRLERDRDAVEAARRSLARATAANALGPVVADLREREAEHRAARDGADAALERARDAVGRADVDLRDRLVLPIPDLADLLMAADQLSAMHARAEPLLAVERNLRGHDRALDEATARVAAARSCIEDERAALSAVGDLAAAESARGELERQAVRVDQLAVAADQARVRVGAAERRDAAAADLTAAQDRRRAAVDAAQAARARWLDLRGRRLASMAAELAGDLRSGEPCTVCGSTVHPAPAAEATAARITADDEAEALRELQGVEQHRDSCTAGSEAAAAALRVATAEAGGDTPRDQLGSELDALVDELARAQAAQAEHDRLAARIAVATSERSRRQGALEAALGDLGRAEADVDRLRTERRGLAEQVAGVRAGAPDLATRLADLAAASAACRAAANAIRVRDEAAARLAVQRERATEAARSGGFADADDLDSAAIDPAERESLATLVESADAERRLVDDRLAALVGDDTAPDNTAPDNTAPDDTAPDDTAPDETGDEGLVAAVARHDEAVRSAEDAAAEESRLRRAVASADRLVAAIADGLAERAPIARDHAVASGLAAVAEGSADNRLRMRLSYYVLAARLQQVAAAASERLLHMTDGRFSLAHTDDRQGGTRRSGLGLVVEDGWYGTTREPSSLSGGETFLASLALALGLADVVVAEAGGAVMDTLFVDEGFGSLDADTLDAVLDVLDELRSGGRAIGVVSHVPELRQRIPAQLGVQRLRSGSRLVQSA